MLYGHQWELLVAVLERIKRLEHLLVDGADNGSGTASKYLLELALLLVFDQLGHGHVLFRDDKVGRRETLDLDLAGGVFTADGQDAVRHKQCVSKASR
jgi:hypothetical protein